MGSAGTMWSAVVCVWESQPPSIAYTQYVYVYIFIHTGAGHVLHMKNDLISGSKAGKT